MRGYFCASPTSPGVISSYSLRTSPELHTFSFSFANTNPPQTGLTPGIQVCESFIKQVSLRKDHRTGKSSVFIEYKSHAVYPGRGRLTYVSHQTHEGPTVVQMRTAQMRKLWAGPGCTLRRPHCRGHLLGPCLGLPPPVWGLLCLPLDHQLRKQKPLDGALAAQLWVLTVFTARLSAIEVSR